MTDKQKFGARLRELRQKSGMTLRELAEKVGVNFTYLSKIENGALPPPREKVIRKLAEVLNYDQDELLTLGGVIPPDIAEILKDRKAREQLRAIQANRTQTAVKKPSPPLLLSFSLKNLFRVALPVFLVVVVAISLWFASPTQALTITYSTPVSAALGNPYAFTVTVTIEDYEYLPIHNVDVVIYSISDQIAYRATLAALPLVTSAAAPHNPLEGTTSGTATVAALADAHWGYTGNATGYVVWNGQAYTFIPGVSGGYGYQGYGAGSTSITYSIIWVSPTSWPQGSYQIETILTTNTYNPGGGNTFTETSDVFTLYVGGGGGGGGQPGTTNLTGIISYNGTLTQTVIAKSEDNLVSLTLPEGTVALTSDGVPLSYIGILPLSPAPNPPAQSNVIGLAYDFSPNGATFTPPITATFTYDPLEIPVGVDPANLIIAYYDTATSSWVTLQNIVVNETTHEVSGQLGHFTPFEVIAFTAPASFTTSDLSITPATVNAGTATMITVTVTNSGDLSSSFDVVLKVDSVVKETKSVTLAGHASEEVSFTLTQDTAGSYAIDANGLTGTLTVNAPPTTTPPTTTPATTTPPTTTPPTTTPPTTTPPTTTPAPTTTQAPGGGIAWWVILIIVIAAVVVIGLIIWLVIRGRRG